MYTTQNITHNLSNKVFLNILFLTGLSSCFTTQKFLCTPSYFLNHLFMCIKTFNSMIKVTFQNGFKQCTKHEVVLNNKYHLTFKNYC